MARIAGVDLPRDKRVEIGLTYLWHWSSHLPEDFGSSRCRREYPGERLNRRTRKYDQGYRQ